LFSYKRRLPSRTLAACAFILSIAILLQMGACSDSGSVGNGLPGPGSEVQVDTFNVTEIGADTLYSFSGNYGYFSVGRFQDPLFGEVNATALIKPALPDRSDNSTVSFGDNTQMTLYLAIHNETTYGDTLASVPFNLVEINELWRGREWKTTDEVPLVGSPIASFTMNNQDTVKIEFSEEWVQKYGNYFNRPDSSDLNRDSLYVREFWGFAIVPQDGGKIITPNPYDSHIMATNMDVSADSITNDSLSIGLWDWAYSVDRADMNQGEAGSNKVISTLERVVHFDFDFSTENLNARNIAKAEIVIYRNNLLLEQSISQAGDAATRPPADTLRLHVVDQEELPQSIDPGSPLYSESQTSPVQNRNLVGIYNEKDQAYHFNVTSYVASGRFGNLASRFSFYLTFKNSNGVMRSTVLYNADTEGKVPKVIITSTEIVNN